MTVVGREIADLGCPAAAGELSTWFEANRASENSTKLSEVHGPAHLRPQTRPVTSRGRPSPSAGRTRNHVKRARTVDAARRAPPENGPGRWTALSTVVSALHLVRNLLGATSREFVASSHHLRQTRYHVRVRATTVPRREAPVATVSRASLLFFSLLLHHNRQTPNKPVELGVRPPRRRRVLAWGRRVEVLKLFSRATAS